MTSTSPAKVLLAGCALAGCGSGPPPATPGGHARPIECLEAVDKRALGPDALVRNPLLVQFRIASEVRPGPAATYLRMTLRNDTDELVWVNYRLKIGLQASDNREVWLDVTDPATGQAVPQGSCPARESIPELTDYVLLSPGSEYSTVQPLMCYRFDGSGPYRIVAHYKDQQSRPPKPPWAAKLFSAQLTSNTIEITVKGPQTQ